MSSGLIELLGESGSILDGGDPQELIASATWGAVVRGLTRLIFDLRALQHIDLAMLIQSDLDRLESAIEGSAIGDAKETQNARYRRWSAHRRLTSDVEGLAALVARNPAFLGESDVDLGSLSDPIPIGTERGFIKINHREFTVSQGKEACVRIGKGKPFSVLVCLHKYAGRTVSHADLLREVWGGRKIEINTMHKAVSELRKLLKDGGIDAVTIESKNRCSYILTISDKTQG